MAGARQTDRRWDALWLEVTAATMAGPADASLVADAALAVQDGAIAWLGPRTALVAPPESLAIEVHRGGGRLLTPALIDCHTHLLFGGDRALDFSRRASGLSYPQIAAAGGGIRSTVALTVAQSAEQLALGALPRAASLAAEGVGVIEVKSGYGLEPAAEIRMLHAVRLLREFVTVDLVPTLLALHALPQEYAHRRGDYVERVCRELVPQVAAEGLASAVDVFCEHLAFTREECAAVLRAARDAGLAVKVHADQLTDTNAAALAAEYGALSADHLEYTSVQGVNALAASGSVAVLLPVPYLMMGEKQPPPVAALRSAAVPMAIATDCNPGSSPCHSLTLAMTLARAQFGLTEVESLRGVTVNAARALNLAATHGVLAVGRRADFCLWDFAEASAFGYWLAPLRPVTIVRAGRPLSAGV